MSRPKPPIPSTTATSGPNRRERRRRWATTAQTAEYLNITPRTVRQMRADGRLTAYMLGGRVIRFDLNEVDSALQRCGGA